MPREALILPTYKERLLGGQRSMPTHNLGIGPLPLTLFANCVSGDLAGIPLLGW